jgi:hypothetical protein
MAQLVVLLITVIFMATVFGFFPVLNPLADGLHRLLYGDGLAHANGTVQDHINDWLGFLPDNSMLRAVFVAAALVLAMVLNVLYYLVAVREVKLKELKAKEREARARTINAYRHQQ